MSRWKASAIHMLISAGVVITIFAVIFFVWYPGVTFYIAGAFSIIVILVGVDLVLGPLLTLIVYKHDKPSLKFDLAVIALVQLCALVYGAQTLYQQRPYYMVFAFDRFEMMPKKYIDEELIRYDELKSKPFAEIIPVFARRPEDPDEFQKFLTSQIEEGKPDLEQRPEYWEPYSAGFDRIVEKIRPLSELKAQSDRDKRRVQRAKEEYGSSHSRLGFVPIGTLDEDIGMIMDMDTAEPLDIIKVNPW